MKKIYFLFAAVSIVTLSTAQVQRMAMVETFTSSTCGPCNSGNANLEDIFDDAVNADKFVSLKYQMDWPGTGDPYFTTEAGSRRSFYSVSAIPFTRIDAATGIYSYDMTQNELEDAYELAPGAELVAYYQVNGQTVDVQVDVKALVDLPSSVRLFIAVFEYTTDNNVKTNGETEFNHVMKKMLPNSTGTTVSSCLAGDSVHIEKSHTFAGSYILPPNATDPINHTTENSVEEFDDLGVAVWLQRSSTKEVYQATYAIKGMLKTDETAQSIAFAKIYPNPACETATIAFDLNVAGDVDVEVYSSDGKVIYAENLTGLEAGRNYTNLNSSTLANGLYVVKIRSANGEFNEKFSVLRP